MNVKPVADKSLMLASKVLKEMKINSHGMVLIIDGFGQTLLNTVIGHDTQIIRAL